MPAAPPQNIKAYALTPTVVRVEWDAAPTPDDGVLSYEAEYKTRMESEWTPFYCDTLNYATLNDLKPNINYEVRVRVVTGKDRSTWEVVDTSTPPATPSITIDTLTSTTVKIICIAASVSDDGDLSSEVEYKTQTESEWTSFGQTKSAFVTLESLEPDIDYESTCASNNRQRRKCLGE